MDTVRLAVAGNLSKNFVPLRQLGHRITESRPQQTDAGYSTARIDTPDKLVPLTADLGNSFLSEDRIHA
jgi:hypothetical protein